MTSPPGDGPEPTATRPFWQRLSFRQTRMAVLVGISLGLLFGALQCLLDLRQVRAQQRQDYALLLHSVEDSAYQAAYSLDTLLAARVVDGLFSFPAIRQVAIEDDLGGTLAARSRPLRPGRLRPLAEFLFGVDDGYSRSLRNSRSAGAVGALRVDIDSYVVAETFLARSGLALAFGLAQTLILAVALSVGFHLMLTRPLASFLEGIRAGRARVPIPAGHAGDDLGDLVAAYNRLSAERGRVESELRGSEARFRAALDNAPAGFLLCDEQGAIELANPAVGRMFGFAADQLVGDSLASILPDLDDPAVRATDDEGAETQGLHRDGTRFPVRFGIGEMTLDGRHMQVASVIDLSTVKRLEAELAQARRLDALGQLTGGVAHDINNILGIIIGNLELARDEVGSSEAGKMIDIASKASERGARLTHRLLAFARQQPLMPRVVNPRRVLLGLDDLLRRTLGAAIEIEFVIDAGLWRCKVDSSQLENVLINLALNARDAMSDGGHLTIDATNASLTDDYVAAQIDVSPGQYVCLAVTDNGCGMAPDVVARAFEPFFTTKGAGRGTGLGLSMAYGFAKQSDGHIRIYSEPGEGTTVKLYLPRSRESGAEDETRDQEVPAVQGRGELVLVVEDDEDLRELVVTQLETLGYRVVEAANAADGLRTFENCAGIELLLTDVVLPGGESGRDLSRSIVARAPGLPTIFMSGYTRNAIFHHGRLDHDVVLLQKPFRKSDLARIVARALGRPAGS